MAMDIKRTSWSGGWATLRDLEIIQTVIDHGSVTNAAERLGISQPAVSQTLNQIEKRCGKNYSFVKITSSCLTLMHCCFTKKSPI